MDVCDLCGQRTTGGGFNRAAGLDICDRCLRGDLEIALRRIGAKIDTKLTIKEEESYGVGSETQYSLSLEGSIGFSRGMSASFGRATAFSRFRDKFGKKIRSGDPFFDEKIAVSSRSPEVLEALLRLEGVQTAIFEFVSVAGGLHIDEGTVKCHVASSSEPPPEVDLTLNLCALLFFMRRVHEQNAPGDSRT